MEEIYHHHHHHHHGHHASDENEGHQLYNQHEASSQGALNSNNGVVTDHYQQQQIQREEAIWSTNEQQPIINVPAEVLNLPANQISGGVQTTNSFGSVSSIDSSAEMSKYFPDAPTPSLSPFRHQPEVEGQGQSTISSNTVVVTNTKTVNAGPYVPISASTTGPIRAPFMAQQQQQQQRPQGIPSYSSQIEGLSVSQALVNDVLIDLQSKVINETLQQYQDESSSGNYLEPLPPIYIRAPQPTIILRSDLNRLRAELGNRVRPPVVYRHPAGAHQSQQHRFQQNTFQVPRFPTPPQQHYPPGSYSAYQNAGYANSDEYKTTSTGGDEHRKEKEERLYNQAVPNDDNVNDNVHSTFDLQGLSTTSFDRYASPYDSSSFLPNLQDQQQQQQQHQHYNEETVLTSSHNINDENVDRPLNTMSRPVRSREEITFDINNCIYRCFEAHRQRVARRRAARQARRARRHKQSQEQQPQYQQVYNTDQYQNLPSQPPYASLGATDQTQWQQQPQSSSHYFNAIPTSMDTSTSVHTSQRPYIPADTYNYTSVGQSTSLPADIQQYQSSDIVDTHTSHIPFSSLSTSTIDATVPIDVQSPATDYYQFKNLGVQEPYIHSNTFDYTSHQTIPPTISSIGATVPGDIQHLTSQYYQQQIPGQFIQPQDTYVQSSGAYEYTAGTDQSQIPTYNYQNVEQQSFQYPYNIENIQQQQPSFNYASVATPTYVPSEIDTHQTEQKQTYDYSSQALSSSDYYQQPTIPISEYKVGGPYSQPTGTFEYSRESYQSQEPIYDYQSTDQQSSQYSYNLGDIQQQQQQSSYNYDTAAATAYSPPDIYTQQAVENQTVDYSNQALSSSDYYQQQQQQPIPVSEYQVQPSGTFEYTRESYQSQEPIYNYQGADQQSSQYSSNVENIQQQQQEQPEQQQTFDYASESTTAYSAPEVDTQQTEQKQTVDYLSQVLSSSDQYQQQPIDIPVSQIYDSPLTNQQPTGASLPTGTIEYTRQAYYSQEPLPDSYTTENFIEQHQKQEDDQSFNVNDYLKKFESESNIISSYPQLTGGQIESSDDQQSIGTITTTPFTIQQNVDTHASEGAAQTYNLQNYTNEYIASEKSQPPPSLFHEEDQQHLLQQTATTEQIYTPVPQSEQHSEIESSSYNTFSSSLPPSAATEQINQQHESITTNTSEFPPPPTPDRHTYQISQQRPSTSYTSIIPSADQPSIYTEPQPIPPSDHRSEDDNEEDEEIFDLRQCIARCYSKYQDLWNKEEQEKYEKQLRLAQQPISPYNQQANAQSSFNVDHRGQPRQYLSTGEIHFIDGSSQTPSPDVLTQSNIAQHTYDQPSYVPQLPTTNLSADSRGQQTIEYSPSLITQTQLPKPLTSDEGGRYEQQQQQQVYDHVLPVPPHLSFNDGDYQQALYFPPQITAQPRQYENIPFDRNEEQQRYRAYSEPPSIQQDTIASASSLQASQTFEQQPRRSVSIPMIRQQQSQTRIPSVHLIDNGRAYETDATFTHRFPRIDPKTGLCLVPCPQAVKYAHLPPHLRPELFCVELPPPGSLPPPPPPRVQQQRQQQQQQQQQRWCVKCCCVPGQTLIKKIVYKQVEEEQQHQEESQYDYASVIDQMATRISVRYGNDIMEEGEAFVSGNYNEQLRVIDFPVYVSGQNDSNLTPLVPVN